jgi:hypothetical protein
VCGAPRIGFAPVAAARCQRLIGLADGTVRADELAGDDDPWTRGRIDRIG